MVGTVSFVLNGGGFVPSIHELANTIQVGQQIVSEISGGDYYNEMAAEVPIEAVCQLVLS